MHWSDFFIVLNFQTPRTVSPNEKNYRQRSGPGQPEEPQWLLRSHIIYTYDSSSTLSHIDFMVFKYQSIGFIGKKEKKETKDCLRQV